MTQAPPGPRTLAIDIGGSHLKASVLDGAGGMTEAAVRVPTPLPSGPAPVLEALVSLVGPLGSFDRISVGFPGVVRRGVILTAPNLGTAAWHNFDLAAHVGAQLGKPIRVLNDASVQGLGVITGKGIECVITLGTGMGFALFENGLLSPHLELSQHPIHGDKTYDMYIGNAVLAKIGRRRWNRRIGKIIPVLRDLINFDSLLIGGGNARLLDVVLNADTRVVANEAGITGGVKLWQPAMDPAFPGAAGISA